jgi:hypothetical protein
MANLSERAGGQQEIGLNTSSVLFPQNKEVEGVNLAEEKGKEMSRVTILYSRERTMYLRRKPHDNH